MLMIFSFPHFHVSHFQRPRSDIQTISVGITGGLGGFDPQFMCQTPQFLLFVCLAGVRYNPLVRIHRNFVLHN